jgi:hypothetical protein
LPSAVLALKPVAGELIWNAEMIERIEAGHTLCRRGHPRDPRRPPAEGGAKLAAKQVSTHARMHACR